MDILNSNKKVKQAERITFILNASNTEPKSNLTWLHMTWQPLKIANILSYQRAKYGPK